MYGQTQIPTGLQTAIQAQMEREVMSGQAKTMTSDETPTVFGQLMQQVAPRPAGVGQAMEQAGLAGQIRAMQMQQAQQAMMQQAMNQQQRPVMAASGGLMGLNPKIDGFADGGIVGYAGPEGSYVVDPEFGGATEEAIIEEALRERRGQRSKALEEFEEERRRNQALVANEGYTRGDIRFPETKAETPSEKKPAPAAQPSVTAAPSGPAAASSAAFYDQAMSELNKLKTKPVSQQEGVNAGIEALAADDEMRRRLGLPTLAEQYSRMSDEDKALAAERQALIAGRLREAQEKRSSGQLGAFLRSARGRTLGDTLGAAERGREAFEAGLTGQIRGFEDLQLEIKGLQIQKQNALNKARDDIAMGRKKDAMASLQDAQNKENEIGAKKAELLRYRAGDVSKESIERARIAAAERDRREGRDIRQQSANESLLRSYDQSVATAVERIEKTLESKHPMAKLFRMNPAIAESNPKAYEAYMKDYNDLYNRTVVPLEKDRDALRERLKGYSGWGQVSVR